MDHVLEIPFSGDAESLFQRAKAKAESQGISMDGDAKKGSFAGLGAMGSYESGEGVVRITFTKKPAMFPQAMVDAMVKKMFV